MKVSDKFRCITKLREKFLQKIVTLHHFLCCVSPIVLGDRMTTIVGKTGNVTKIARMSPHRETRGG